MTLKILTPFLFCLFLLGTVHAQPANPKIRSLKIEVVTSKMNLSSEQKSSFLPLYNRYSDELLAVYRKRKSLNDNANSMYVINERQKLDQTMVDIKGKYKTDFLKVISPQQLSQMYQSEEEFKSMLIEQLKKGKKF